jgi:hypothetical protein
MLGARTRANGVKLGRRRVKPSVETRILELRAKGNLVGLSIEETFEFETLGDTPSLDESGWRVPWQEDVPITPREKRWLELYQTHQRAWWALVAAVATPRKT